MRTAWKILWMSAASIVALGVLAFAALWLVNLHDEPLGEQARAMRQPPAHRLPDEQNLYLAFMGAHAPAGVVPTIAGAARVAAVNRELERLALDPDPHFSPPDDDPAAVAFEGKVPVCGRIDDACWRDAPGQATALAALLAANREPVARYRALWTLPGYEDTSVPDLMLSGGATIPAFGDEARKWVIADLAVRLRSSPPAGQADALRDLMADLAMWRRVLAGSGNLIASMVALARVHADEQLLALAMADPSVPFERMPGIEPAPLFEDGDWHIGGALRGEFRGSVPMWNRFRNPANADWVATEDGESRWHRAWRSLGNRMAMHFVLPTATENLYARVYARFIAAADGPPRGLPASLEDSMPWARAQASPGLARSAYNPMGRILVSIALPAIEGYPLRSWDVAAHQRMVRLAWEIRRQRIADDAIPGFMAAHPEWSTHPVDGARFAWDAHARTLSLRPLGRDSGTVPFSIPVWQPAVRAAR